MFSGLSITEEKRYISSKNYKAKETDYCRTYTHKELKISIGTAEVQGGRPSQEDYLALSVLDVKGLDTLTPELRRFALELTFEEIQQKYGDDYYQGSTGCVAATWIDEKQGLHVTTANLGDSSAYLIILNSDNSVYTAGRLNTLHKPTGDEALRIKRDGGYVKDEHYPSGLTIPRLNGDLSLSRAFGDTRHEKNGLSHTPDIIDHPTITLTTGQKAYVLLACDGLDPVDEKTIGKIFKENNEKSPAEIANLLVDKALHFAPQGDNVSAAVLPVGNTPISAGIFDGHGGSRVSYNIGNHFYPRLRENILYLSEDFEKARHLMEDRVRLFKEHWDKKFIEYLSGFDRTSGFSVHIEKGVSHLETSIVIETDKNHHALNAGIKSLADQYGIKFYNPSRKTIDDRIIIDCQEGVRSPEIFDKFINEVKGLVKTSLNFELKYESEKASLKDTLKRYKEQLPFPLLPGHEKNNKHLTKMIGLVSLLMQQTDAIKKKTDNDYKTAEDILKSCNKILSEPSRKNIRDHNKLAEKIQEKNSTLNAVCATMMMIGAALLILTCVFVATATWGALSIPSVIGISAGVSLFSGGYGLFCAPSEYKIAKTMDNLAEEVPLVTRRRYDRR